MRKLRYFYFPTLRIGKRMWDMRQWWIEYPYRHWVWKWEFEEDKLKWIGLTARRLSWWEVNFRGWHEIKDKRYRHRHGIPGLCRTCGDTKEGYTDVEDTLCTRCDKRIGRGY